MHFLTDPRTVGFGIICLLLFATAVGQTIISGEDKSHIKNLSHDILAVTIERDPPKNKLSSSREHAANSDGDVESASWIQDPLCATEQHSRFCTPTGKSWSRSRTSEPCQKLQGKRVAFVGDSYARHAYVAFLSWLSGNYRDASLASNHDRL
jgi:hypothetical protein